MQGPGVLKGVLMLKYRLFSLSFHVGYAEKWTGSIWLNKILSLLAQIDQLDTCFYLPRPEGLGPTVPELGLAEANIKPYSKTCFSMAAVPGKRLHLLFTIHIVSNIAGW